jgi:hypothetical protein
MRSEFCAKNQNPFSNLRELAEMIFREIFEANIARWVRVW